MALGVERLSRRNRAVVGMLFCSLIAGCHTKVGSPGTVVVILESSPNNLDLRQGTDAQSSRVGGLIFDALVKKDDHYNLQPWLATSWEQPDPLTWVIHLRDGVRFSDGRPLEAADIVWTIESLIDPKLTAGLPGGTLVSALSGNFASVDRAEARDRLTVVVHLKRPDAGLLFNMSDGLFGVVPRGSGSDFGLHPVGSGPFKFVSQVQDKEVIVERNHECWSNTADAAGNIERVRFMVVPDGITSALELRKGSADVSSNALTPDMVYALRDTPGLETSRATGSNVWYLNFNVTDGALHDKRVRQAIALAIDRPAIIASLWRGHARLAESLLPEGHWAAAAHDQLTQYPHDPTRAQALLDAAGYRADKTGVRIRLTLKVSTEEETRLLAAVLQQQLRAAGIQLSIRSAEFGTFYSDVTKGAFQMYVLKWVGSNEDPDIFRYMYSSASLPPKGANRGRYTNPQVDALLAKAAQETGPPIEVEARRRAEYVEVEQILADDMPSEPLWYPDSEVVHTTRLEGVRAQGDGNFGFLRDAHLP
jgi:peptide/nickel transport system substrate-binding protein